MCAAAASTRRATVLLASALVAGAAHADPDLVPLAEIRAIERDAPWACVNYDPVGRTCEAVTRDTWRDEAGGEAETVLAVVVPGGAARSMAVITQPFWVEGDMTCGRLADVRLEARSSPPLPADVAGRIEAAFRAAVARRGAVACQGLAREGDHFVSVDYLDGGLSERDRVTIRYLGERPALRPVDAPV